jgi:hypothetical protein
MPLGTVSCEWRFCPHDAGGFGSFSVGLEERFSTSALAIVKNRGIVLTTAGFRHLIHAPCGAW